MAKPTARHATTLSISLTPELAAAVNDRVATGLYGSASELLREALRLFLAQDAARQRALLPPQPGGASIVAEGSRAWSAASDLAVSGEELRTARERRKPADTASGGAPRPAATPHDTESDAVIRPSPERLRKLLDGHTP